MPKNGKCHDTDMIGTTRLITDVSGNPVNPVTYTAFGERPCSLPGGNCQGVSNHRYGYAGAWGYQSHDVTSGRTTVFPFTGRGYLTRPVPGIAQ